MAKYSYAQLEGLWIQAGGDASQAPLMASIAMAESGGDSSAYNPSGATGLWQILGNPFPGDAKDPLTNAKMAVSKYKSQGLGAWVTYTNGAYRQFLQSGVTPVSPDGTAVTAASTTDSGTGNCCAIGFNGISNPLPFGSNSLGSFCLLSRSQVNSIFGITIIAAGMLVGITGTAWLLAYAFKNTKVYKGAEGLVLGSTTGRVSGVFNKATKELEGRTSGRTPGRASNVGTIKEPKKPEPLKLPSKDKT